MTDAQSAFRGLVKGVGAMLRAEGFRGSAGSWHMTNDRGDVGIVNLQKSQGNTSDHVRFIVNLSIVPQPWFEWTCDTMLVTPPSTPKEYHGLWRERLDARSDTDTRERWWEVTDDLTAHRCRLDVERQLLAHGIPRLRGLIDRRHLLGELRREAATKINPKLEGRTAIAAAILLADEGESPELEAAVSLVRDQLGEWKELAHFEVWVSARAARTRGAI